VTNTGSPIKGWAVEVDFGQNVTLGGTSNVKHKPEGGQNVAVWEFRNCCDWNGNLATNASASFHFQGSTEGPAIPVPSCRFIDLYDGRGRTDYPNYNTNPLPADMTGMGSTAVQMASRIKLGWNIGNTMEAIGGETNWGNPRVTNALIQAVKQAGFDSIRIPAAWDQYANQTTGEIDEAWLNRVKEVVQYCIDNDMPTILNIHWDGGWLENNITPEKQAVNIAKQRAFWQQIATHLRDFDGRLMFAGANEPNVETIDQMPVLMSYHQTFVDAVRATGGRNAHRILVVQGPSTDIERTSQFWAQMLVDTAQNRLMVELHFYTPFQFTLMTNDASWGNQFFYWGAGNHSTTDTVHNPTWGEEATIDSLFATVKNQFVNQGIPVVLGEFATMRRTGLSGADLELHLRSRAYWYQYVTQRALANGILPYAWDAVSDVMNRSNNTVYDTQVMDALRRGAGKQ
jgi:endoglucanase